VRGGGGGEHSGDAGPLVKDQWGLGLGGFEWGGGVVTERAFVWGRAAAGRQGYGTTKGQQL